jgi:hypothetical protein
MRKRIHNIQREISEPDCCYPPTSHVTWGTLHAQCFSPQGAACAPSDVEAQSQSHGRSRIPVGQLEFPHDALHVVASRYLRHDDP